MAPIWGRYGPFLLYAYTVVLGLGLLVALGWGTWRRGRSGAAAGPWLDRVLAALLGGVLLGRAGFIFLHWSYFDDRLVTAANMWRGGLHYHSALLGGLIIILLWPGRRPSAAADALAPGMMLLSAAGWLACYYEGCAYGAETTLGLWAADLPDVYGVYAVRYQTQLLGVAGSVLLLGLLLWLDRREGPAGRLFWVALLGISLLHGALTLLRGDPQPLLAGWRLDTVLDAGLVLVATPLAFRKSAPDAK